MKKSNSNVLEFTTKFINSNFRIKVFGRTEDGKKINTLVGVSGILKLIGAELFNKFISINKSHLSSLSIFVNLPKVYTMLHQRALPVMPKKYAIIAGFMFMAVLL